MQSTCIVSPMLQWETSSPFAYNHWHRSTIFTNSSRNHTKLCPNPSPPNLNVVWVFQLFFLLFLKLKRCLSFVYDFMYVFLFMSILLQIGLWNSIISEMDQITCSLFIFSTLYMHSAALLAFAPGDLRWRWLIGKWKELFHWQLMEYLCWHYI